MNRKQKHKLTRRELWLFSTPVLVLSAALMLPIGKQWLASLRQDRLYLNNNLSEPIVKFRVWFFGYGEPSHELVFRNVPSNGQQWQLFGPKWGNGDSGRYITFEGITASGKRIGSSETKEFVTVDDLFPKFGLGAKFYVTVQANGALEIDENR